jgi:TP901 family phage tail tape measure protein
MVDIARLVARIAVEGVPQATAQLAGMGKTVDGTAKGMTALGTAAKVSMIAGVVGGIALANKAVMDMGMSWEDAFTGVKKTVEATDAELAQLSQGIRQMAKEMPASREAIAGVAEAAGQLGIKNEAVMGFARTMTDMGVATNMSSAQAADALARLANITQMPQENFDRLGSTVVALGNKMAATESEIVTMGLRLAGAGEQIGMSEAQILSFAAALSSVGIEAEMGGSAFSRVMIDIATSVDTADDKLDTFAKVAGMSASQFSAAFRQDAAGAIVAFVEGLGRMKSQGESTFGVLDELELSEIRVRTALLNAAGAGDLFRKSLEVGSKAWEENNALTKEAEERYKTTASKVEIMQNKFTDLGVTLFEKVQPTLNDSIDAMGRLADHLKRGADNASLVASTMPGMASSAMQATGPVGRLADAWAAVNAELGKLTGYDIQAALAPYSTRVRMQLEQQQAGIKAANEVSRSFFASERDFDPGITQADIDSANERSRALFGVERALSAVNKAEDASRDLRIQTQFAIDSYDEKHEAESRTKAWQDAAEAREKALKKSGGGGGGASAISEATRELDKLGEAADEVIGAMDDRVGALGITITKLNQSYGDRWIEQWHEVNAAIQQTYADTDRKLRDLENQEMLAASIQARRDNLEATLAGAEKLYSQQTQDARNLWTYEKSISRAQEDADRELLRAKDDAEKAAIRERLSDQLESMGISYRRAQEDLAQRRLWEEEDARWREENITRPRAALEKELHDEEVNRRRAAILEEREAKLKSINDEWAAWQKTERDKTDKSIQEARNKAAGELIAWTKEFYEKIPDEAGKAAEEIARRVQAALGSALLKSGGGVDTEGNWALSGGVTGTDPEHAPGGSIHAAWVAAGMPSYGEGGYVPGPFGAPQFALVHGGERVLTAAEQRRANQPIVINLQVDGKTLTTVVAQNLDYVQARRV